MLQPIKFSPMPFTKNCLVTNNIPISSNHLHGQTKAYFKYIKI